MWTGQWIGGSLHRLPKKTVTYLPAWNTDMRTTQSKCERPHRQAWRTAGVALLGLLSSLVGCRSSGVDSRAVPASDPPQASSVAGQVAPASPTPNPTVGLADSAHSTAIITVADDSGENAASELVLTAARSDAGADKTAGQEEDKKEERKKLAGSADTYQVDRTLPSPAAGMATPSLPPPEKVQSISLAVALAQAGAANPVIAIAQQAVRVSQAERLQALALLLPSVNVGSSYDLHNGPLQGSIGVIRKVDRQALYYGLGAYAVVAGSVAIPGLWIDVPLTDALFEPRAASYVVANRRAAAQATNNQVLLDVATTYLDLLGAEGRLAVIRQSEADFTEVARLTAAWSKPGISLLRDADARRATADLRQLQFEEQKAQEDVAVAAADLSRLLNLDPAVRLQTGDVPIQLVQFIDPKEPLPKLLEIAARYRPELLAAASNIRASQTRVRQETMRPLLPLLWAGLSAGDFGGGAVAIQNPPGVPNSALTDGAGQPNGQTTPKFGNIASRVDVDVMAFWTLQNFGLGNLALIRQRRGQLGRAEAQRLAILNQVRLEVSEAYNRSADYFRSIAIERRNVQEATEGFQRDLQSIIGGVALPIEVLDNAERLVQARQNLLAALINFDRAQFQLFVALGQPPTLVVEDDKPSPPPPPPLAQLPPPPEKR
jgi:outer membrane protein TolC